MKQKVNRTNRRRGPRHNIPADLSDTSAYYSALESEIYGTKYSDNIDPWDLENYDYVRKKLSATSICESSTPSPAGEPITSTFFYLPNNTDECPACYAGMDEQTFYNTKYHDMIFNDEREFTMYSDFDSPYSTERNNSSCEEENTISSSLKLHTSGFRVPASGGRKMVVPKEIPQLEFPSPPPYDYCDINGYYSQTDCYECLSQIYGTSTYGYGYGSSTYGSRKPSSLYSTYSNKFALSKKGLLQIDYSCNWNDLDRYIAKDF